MQVKTTLKRDVANNLLFRGGTSYFRGTFLSIYLLGIHVAHLQKGLMFFLLRMNLSDT